MFERFPGGPGEGRNFAFEQGFGGPGGPRGRRGPRGQWGPWGFEAGRMGRGFRGPWGPFGPRARRGDVRAAILALLAEQPMHGYQVMQELESRSGGAWRVSPGSVYPTLQLLEDEGLVTGRDVEGKRVFSLTEAGTAQVESRKQASASAPWEEVAGGADERTGKLRGAAFQLGAAAIQAAHAGSADQVDRTIEVLNEARRQVYSILAEGK